MSWSGSGIKTKNEKEKKNPLMICVVNSYSGELRDDTHARTVRLLLWHPDLPPPPRAPAPALQCLQSRMRGRQQCCLQNPPKHTFLRACRCWWRRGGG